MAYSMEGWTGWEDVETTETDIFITEEKFSPNKINNKTPFGTRWGGGTQMLTIEHIQALLDGKYVAVDVECEYVLFLKYDEKKDEHIK